MLAAVLPFRSPRKTRCLAKTTTPDPAKLREKIYKLIRQLPLQVMPAVERRLGDSASVPLPDDLALFLNRVTWLNRDGSEGFEFEGFLEYEGRAYRSRYGDRLPYDVDTAALDVHLCRCVDAYPPDWLPRLHRFLKRALANCGETREGDRLIYSLAGWVEESDASAAV